MVEWKLRVGHLALMLTAVVFSGCPIATITLPQLNTTPDAIDFGASQTTHDIALSNTGGGTLDWTAQEVIRANEDEPWVPADISWLTLSADGGAITTDLAHITLTASRAGLSAGRYTNTGVQVTSNGGTLTVPVSIAVAAQLQVTPRQLSLSSVETSASFTITNNGAVPLQWAVLFLSDASDPTSGIPLPTGYAASPPSGTNQSLASTSVAVTFPAGANDFALVVESSSGREVVRFSVGSALTGFSITPAVLTLSIASQDLAAGQQQPASTLQLKNVGTLPISWTISLAERINPNASPPLAADPILGTTQVGATSEVKVRVTDPKSVTQGDGIYELVVRVGDAFQVVPIIVEVLPLPIISLALPPEVEFLQPPVVETTLIDFGEDLVQEQFYIVNTGSRESELFFQISYADQGQQNALIADVSPLRGDTNGGDRDFFLFDEQVYTDGVPIAVTINRNNLVEDLETRTITVTAYTNDKFTTKLTSVETKSIEIRVAKPPFKITGALNRARAPSMLRFVFSNRDEFGQIVPLQTSEDKERISYEIFENKIPLDLNETSQFLTFDYRGNVVLILDFTGSMYNAGTTGTDPLEPGEAVQFMREAAKTFIDDLPPNYNLQIMFHTDRIPENRIIQRFTNDRKQLKDALDRFTVAPTLFGDSDIVETVKMAIESLEAEDPTGTLPFDDADVRAVVFITDGKETVAGDGVTGIGDRAQEAHARLYPVAYNPNGDAAPLADLVVASEKSGGYLYTVGSVENLPAVFGTRKSLEVLSVSSTATNIAMFTVRNRGGQALTFSVNTAELPWINAATPNNGSLNTGASQTVSVALNPVGIADGTRLQASASVVTGGGDSAEIEIEFVVSGGAATQISTSVRDETGTIWEELNNQSVLTYLTPKEDSFEYLLSGTYIQADGTIIEGPFQRDSAFVLGDPRIGQVSLHTSGITEDLTTLDPQLRYRAEIFVYADYVPRNINAFYFRFVPTPAPDLSPADQALLDDAIITVERAPAGLFDDTSSEAGGTAVWRLLPRLDGRYDVLTDEENPLSIGAFGNLLKITVTNLSSYVNAFGNGARQPEFFLAMRMDNRFYFSPQSEGQPSSTKYFIYPGGIANDDRALSVALGESDLASPAQFVEFLSLIPDFNPEDEGALDTDMDTVPDFNDPLPGDDGFPASRVVPNPVDIKAGETTFTITIRNNLLDSFTWSVDETTFPSWIIADQTRYGDGAASETPIRPVLAPGESEAIQFGVSSAGLTPGTITTESITIRIENSEFTFISDEEVTVTLEVAP